MCTAAGNRARSKACWIVYILWRREDASRARPDRLGSASNPSPHTRRNGDLDNPRLAPKEQTRTWGTGSLHAKTKRLRWPGAFDIEIFGLQRPHVLGLQTFGTLRHLELHALAFLQAAEAVGLNRGEVHEYILTALAADESVTLGIVKPLHCSLFHRSLSRIPFGEFTLEGSRKVLQGRYRLVKLDAAHNRF